MASVSIFGLAMPVFTAPILGSGPIVSKKVEGSGKLAAGTAVVPLTVGRTFEKVTSSEVF